MKSAVLYFVMMIASMGLGAQPALEKENFEKENSSLQWKLRFKDNGIRHWEKKWFVDGFRGSIENSARGMLFSAGPVDGDHACHSVLWTKKSPHKSPCFVQLSRSISISFSGFCVA